MKKLVVANWKMNGDIEFMQDFFANLDSLNNAKLAEIDVTICPPSPLIIELAKYTQDKKIIIGAEDCHFEEKGAFTGDVSVKLLKSLGVEQVIVGHSERREYHFETNQMVHSKAVAALANEILPIICVGETELERENNSYKEIIIKQLQESVPYGKEVVIAYEPIWAIGTGKVPNNKEIAEIFAIIKDTLKLDGLRILYGGSVNSKNCDELSGIADLSGYLVGSASLKPEGFSKIVNSLL